MLAASRLGANANSLLEIFKNMSTESRLNTVRLFGQSKSTDGVWLFLHGIKDRDWKVRTYSIIGLGATKNYESLSLIRNKLKDRNADVRAAAVIVIGSLHDQLAFESIEKLVTDKSIATLTGETIDVLAMRTLEVLKDTENKNT